MTKALDIRPLQCAGVSEEGINFVCLLLQVQPERRPTIDLLEASSWLADISQVAAPNSLTGDSESDEFYVSKPRLFGEVNASAFGSFGHT